MPTIHNLIQGSPEWHQFRLEHFGASEAAAMLGLSSNVKRSELLRMKHTGQPKEFSDWVQENILDNGHAVEALARPMAEAIIGDELYPATYSEGKLSASCDGLTMDGITAFEHKQWNQALAASVADGCVPDEHMPQCQQVMMVTGATRLLFMVSDGTPERCRYTWVESDSGWRKTLLQGWTQFAEDLANYQPTEDAPEVVAAPIEQLPALLVQVEGRVLATNLDQFKQAATAFIKNIKTDLATDQDFADAEKQTKFLKEGEDKLDTVKSQALAQTASIDELFRAIDYIREEMRAKRLTLEKAVKTRKETIRTEIFTAGKAALGAHIAALNTRLGKPYMPAIPENFAGVMKGKKTIASLRDAVDTELARCKIAANEIADRIQINLNTLRELAADYPFLFADAGQLVLKANDDLTALVKLRVSEHREAEEKKAEQARIKAEADAALAKATKETVVVGDIGNIENIGALRIEPGKVEVIPKEKMYDMPVAAQAETARPTDDQIIGAIALRFHVHEATVINWLLNMDLKSASDRMAAKEFNVATK